LVQVVAVEGLAAAEPIENGHDPIQLLVQAAVVPPFIVEQQAER
jgi:hypothetical protein